MKNRVEGCAWLFAVAAIAAGCSAEGSGGWAGTVTDSAGVTMVGNPDAGLWDAASQWTVIEDLLIGESDGNDPDYQFGSIVGIAVSSDERIFVMDQQARQIKVFDQDGQHVQTFGRPGSGPGEIGAGAGPVLMATGDTIVVPDLANQRMSLFTADGEYIASNPLSFQSGIPVRWETSRSGAIANQVRPFPNPNQPPDSMDVIGMRAIDGSVTDTLRRFPSGRTFTVSRDTPEFNFFTAEPAWALGSNGQLYFGINDDYRIELYASDGALRRVVTKPFEREPVTPGAQEVFTEALERAWTEAGVPAPALDRLKSAVNFAEFFPAYLQMLSGPSNSLWVQHVQAPNDLTAEERESFNPLLGLGAPRWDVFDAEGRYLGIVTMPDRFQPLRFIDDRIYGVWRDELDVQYAMRVRVTMGDMDTGDVPIGGGTD